MPCLPCHHLALECDRSQWSRPPGVTGHSLHLRKVFKSSFFKPIYIIKLNLILSILPVWLPDTGGQVLQPCLQALRGLPGRDGHGAKRHGHRRQGCDATDLRQSGLRHGARNGIISGSVSGSVSARSHTMRRTMSCVVSRLVKLELAAANASSAIFHALRRLRSGSRFAAASTSSSAGLSATAPGRFSS